MMEDQNLPPRKNKTGFVLVLLAFIILTASFTGYFLLQTGKLTDKATSNTPIADSNTQEAGVVDVKYGNSDDQLTKDEALVDKSLETIDEAMRAIDESFADEQTDLNL